MKKYIITIIFLITLSLNSIFSNELIYIISAELQNKEIKLGAFLIYGNYRMEGASIKLKLTIFSNSFSKVMSEAEVELPMETVPLGMQIIHADPDKINSIAKEIDNLYGESELDIYVTTSRGTETIKVIASTRQFTDITADFKSLGMTTRGIFIKETESEKQETMAEAKVLYTILPE